MKKLKLGKSWNKHKAGATLEVDDLRAAWLVSHGYIEKEQKKKSGKKEKAK